MTSLIIFISSQPIPQYWTMWYSSKSFAAVFPSNCMFWKHQSESGFDSSDLGRWKSRGLRGNAEPFNRYCDYLNFFQHTGSLWIPPQELYLICSRNDLSSLTSLSTPKSGSQRGEEPSHRNLHTNRRIMTLLQIGQASRLWFVVSSALDGESDLT